MSITKRKLSMDSTVTTEATATESLRSSISSATSRSSASRSILRSQDSSRSLSSRRASKVAFDTVDVCEHAITLGDNVVSEGAPLTIEWNAQSCVILSVDEYELFRLPNNQPMRNSKPRKLSADERFCLLSLSGIPMRSSLKAAAEATRTRLSRKETVDELIERQLALEKKKKESKFFRSTKAMLSKLRLDRPTSLLS